MDARLVGGKLLRRGYTTGSCAAAAAAAAAQMLLSQAPCPAVTLTTPGGEVLALEVTDASYTPEAASCAVRKQSGDDPDITNGVAVYARVAKAAEGIAICGGEGIGLVTRPGLDQPAGAHAINTGPRGMITRECAAVCRRYGYGGGLAVTISIPGGEELARRTFNPRLGIEGGLSVLGTTGIVEPMSEAALADTVRAGLRLLRAAGHGEVTLTIGNYGEAFARHTLRLPLTAHVKCANFIGEALAAAAELGFDRAVVIGHIGKLVKLGIGVTNTHSNHGDGRIETLLVCALEAGAPLEALRRIHSCVSTDAALDILRGEGLLNATVSVLKRRITDTLHRHVAGHIAVKLICFRGMGDNQQELFALEC